MTKVVEAVPVGVGRTSPGGGECDRRHRLFVKDASLLKGNFEGRGGIHLPAYEEEGILEAFVH